MHSVYHTFEYHIKNSTNAMDLVTDVVMLDPTMVLDRIPSVNNDLIINDDNIGEDEGCSAPVQVGVNNVTSDGLKKDQNFQIESPQIGKDTCNSPIVQSYEHVQRSPSQAKETMLLLDMNNEDGIHTAFIEWRDDLEMLGIHMI